MVAVLTLVIYSSTHPSGWPRKAGCSSKKFVHLRFSGTCIYQVLEKLDVMPETVTVAFNCNPTCVSAPISRGIVVVTFNPRVFLDACDSHEANLHLTTPEMCGCVRARTSFL